VATFLGCASSQAGDVGSGANTASKNDPPAANDGKNNSGFDTSNSSSPAQSDCSEAAKLVYVVSYEERDLYSFNPAALEFKRIGTLDCAGNPSILPRSMAVDRQGVAWINHTDGRIYKVDTKDASCVDSGFEPPSADWAFLNMGFSSDAAGSSAETLYVVSALNKSVSTDPEPPHRLGKIDTTTLKLTEIGDFSGELKGVRGELTGTGSGKLFGFFRTPLRMTFSELDPKTAASIGELVPVLDTNDQGAYAFSFWGGDLWFYSTPTTDAPSQVIQYKVSGDKSQTVVLGDVGGFQIVGAGVSTCAPTTPIR
jgi:hypothetical protein